MSLAEKSTDALKGGTGKMAQMSRGALCGTQDLCTSSKLSVVRVSEISGPLEALHVYLVHSKSRRGHRISRTLLLPFYLD